MKNIVIVAVLLALLSSPAFATFQQWGEPKPGSRLIHNQVFTWYNTFDEPNNPLTIRRPFMFPRVFHPNIWGDLPKIAAVIVDHHGCGVEATATLMMGGPKSRYVHLDFESVPGGCIEATIQIWAR